LHKTILGCEDDMNKKLDYIWQFRHLNNLEPDDKLAESIHEVFLNGFGLKEGWSKEGIRKALRRSTILGLLADSSDHLGGYAMYTIPDAPLMGTYFIWEDAICLKKEVQGNNLSSNVWNMSASLYPNRKFGWIGGRTQNPLVVKRYSKLGSLYPFESTYEQGDGKLVMDYLLQNIAEVKDVKQLDKDHGICHFVYREGRLGDYSMQVNDIEPYEKQLSEWGFHREQGDAVVIVSRLARSLGTF